jgi:hypothetical protein
MHDDAQEHAYYTERPMVIPWPNTLAAKVILLNKRGPNRCAFCANNPG